jgi:hypothetical protein
MPSHLQHRLSFSMLFWRYATTGVSALNSWSSWNVSSNGFSYTSTNANASRSIATNFENTTIHIPDPTLLSSFTEPLLAPTISETVQETESTLDNMTPTSPTPALPPTSLNTLKDTEALKSHPSISTTSPYVTTSTPRPGLQSPESSIGMKLSARDAQSLTTKIRSSYRVC